jgi:hypothetical protein
MKRPEGHQTLDVQSGRQSVLRGRTIDPQEEMAMSATGTTEDESSGVLTDAEYRWYCTRRAGHLMPDAAGTGEAISASQVREYARGRSYDPR